MKNTLITIAIALSLIISFHKITEIAKRYFHAPETTQKNVSHAAVKLENPVILQQNKPALDPEKQDTITILTLEKRNTVVFRGPVSDRSVTLAMQKIRKMDQTLPKETPIYLVLDTPGGSVFAGLDFIDFVNGLDRRVETITLFAASMGFQFVQNMGTRYIVTNGTLMSHRASLGGLGGQIKGELETRYSMIRRKVDFLDHIAAKRMQLDLPKYESMVINEYWVHGFDAVEEKAADKEILLKCGESMSGVESFEVETLFGPITLGFSECPLMKYPLEINLNEVDESNREQAKKVVYDSFTKPGKFVKDYLDTGKFYEVFR